MSTYKDPMIRGMPWEFFSYKNIWQVLLSEVMQGLGSLPPLDITVNTTEVEESFVIYVCFCNHFT